MLSLGWIYVLIFVALLGLAAAFAVGRHFAPPVEPAQSIEAPDALVGEAEQIGAVKRETEPALTGVSGVGPGRPVAETPVEPAPSVPEPAKPVAVASGNMYAVQVITYPKDRTPESPDVAGTLAFLKEKGFPDVRTYRQRSNNYLVVVVGSFATTQDAELKRIISDLKTAEYKGGAPFAQAYATTLKNLQ